MLCAVLCCACGRCSTTCSYVSKCRGSGRVGSGRDRRRSKCHLSGRVIRARDGSLAGVMTGELFSAGPRVGPANLARGSVFLQTYSCLPESNFRDPWVRNDIFLPEGPISCRYSELQASIIACRAITSGISDEAYIIRRTRSRMKP